MKTKHSVVNTRTSKVVLKRASLREAMLFIAMMRHNNNFIIVGR